jgi:hypothetical protein
MYRTRSSTAVFVSLSNLLKREYFYQPTVISTNCGSVDFELSMVRWNAKIPFDLWSLSVTAGPVALASAQRSAVA